MTKREIFSSTSPWEPIAGYSRAVRVGSMIFISGTVSLNEQGKVVGRGDAYLQACQILRIFEQTLKRAEAGLQHIVRTRLFLTNIADAEKVCRAHAEFFANILPASTLIEVKGLILPELLVEMEADAII